MADLPTLRELELETLLRQRDAQVAELTDEVTQLRLYLSTQPAPSTTDPISLPPALVSLLLPHINDHSSNASAASNSVTAALTQRAKILQEENEELYELLKTGETGRLKEDVRALRRVVLKLEGALKESHQVITSLSSELEKSHEAIMASGRPAHVPSTHAPSRSPVPRSSYQVPPHLSAANGSSKPLPTGPRAHKKPRLSESHTPPTRANMALPHPPKTFATNSNSIPINDVRGRRASVDKKSTVSNMDVDEDQRTRPRSPQQERGRDRARGRGRDGKDRGREPDKEKETKAEPERERERDRDRVKKRDRDRSRDKEHERERDKERSSRRSGRSGASNANGGGGTAGGGSGGGGSRRGGRGANNGNAAYPGGDRTLAERMGL